MAFALLLTIALTVPVRLYLIIMAAALVAATAPIVLVLQARFRFHLLVMLVVTAVALPLQLDSGGTGRGLNSSLPLALVLCLGWTGAGVLRMRSDSWKLPRYAWASVVFVGVTLAAFLGGLYPRFPVPPAPLRAQVAELALFTVSIGLMLLVAREVRCIAKLSTLTWAFLWAGAVTCMLQLSPSFDFIAHRTTAPATIGSAFWVWIVAIASSQALLNRRLSAFAKISLLALVAGALFHCVFQRLSWASGWLPPLIALGLVLAVRFPRPVAGGTLVLTPIVLFFGKPMWDSIMSGESYSLFTRMEAWKVTLEMAWQEPFIGLGLANYYHYAVLFPILGWRVKFSSHNNYLDLLAQSGVLGLAAFAWLSFELLRVVLRLYSYSPSGFPRAYAAGAAAGFVAVLVSGMLGDWVIPFVYNTGVSGFRSSLVTWLFIGGALALDNALKEQRAAEPVLT